MENSLSDSLGSHVAWLSKTRRAASSAVVVCSARRRANGVSS
jgi:hypothetical protein